ncbi:hypothetical protein K227x_09910 [Rubripirellula lacrimiformis]|uniref:Uncharacterized protein n=2 Tax=Rubripirellula lacrimiformis TaxID=1930273 RepID=A0A517N657_9BACT|nr:hypothetical protein K227x_09910 [Rubripirellula lacrimiformis]
MHVIRLRKPWQKTAADGIVLRVDVPEPPHDFDVTRDDESVGVVDYERRFNSPTGLDATVRVYLRIDGWEGELVDVHLNDRSLVSDVDSLQLRIDITDWVLSANRLVIRLNANDQITDPRLSGEVTLAIE